MRAGIERAAQEAHRLCSPDRPPVSTGAIALGDRHGLDGVISFDMGGTSLDVCLVQGGVPSDDIACRRSRTIRSGAVGRHRDGWRRRWQHRNGRPSRAGCGSVRRVPVPTRVRPRTAGWAADATLTDAHVVAGILGDEPLAGRLPLDAEEAERAVVRGRGTPRPRADAGGRRDHRGGDRPQRARAASRVGRARVGPARVRAGGLRRRRSTARRTGARRARRRIRGRPAASGPVLRRGAAGREPPDRRCANPAPSTRRRASCRSSSHGIARTRELGSSPNSGTTASPDRASASLRPPIVGTRARGTNSSCRSAPSRGHPSADCARPSTSVTRDVRPRGPGCEAVEMVTLASRRSATWTATRPERGGTRLADAAAGRESRGPTRRFSAGSMSRRVPVYRRDMLRSRNVIEGPAIVS